MRETEGERGRERGAERKAVARESMSRRNHLSATSASESPGYRSALSQRPGKCTIRVGRCDASSLGPGQSLRQTKPRGGGGRWGVGAFGGDEDNCGDQRRRWREAGVINSAGCDGNQLLRLSLSRSAI